MGYNSTGSEGVAVGFKPCITIHLAVQMSALVQSRYRNEDGDYNVSVGRYSLYWNEVVILIRQSAKSLL